MKVINNIKNIDVVELTEPLVTKLQSIPVEQYVKYIAYLIVFTISLTSVINTKEYIIDNKTKETKKIIIHAIISLILLWTAIYFLVR